MTWLGSSAQQCSSDHVSLLCVHVCILMVLYLKDQTAIVSIFPVQSCSKEEIVQRIQVFVDGHLEEWLQEVDPREFLDEYPKQAIELKVDCVRRKGQELGQER